MFFNIARKPREREKATGGAPEEPPLVGERQREKYVTSKGALYHLTELRNGTLFKWKTVDDGRRR
jgi:hypothetical protein